MRIIGDLGNDTTRGLSSLDILPDLTSILRHGFREAMRDLELLSHSFTTVLNLTLRSQHFTPPALIRRQIFQHSRLVFHPIYPSRTKPLSGMVVA